MERETVGLVLIISCVLLGGLAFFFFALWYEASVCHKHLQDAYRKLAAENNELKQALVQKDMDAAWAELSPEQRGDVLAHAKKLAGNG